MHAFPHVLVGLVQVLHSDLVRPVRLIVAAIAEALAGAVVALPPRHEVRVEEEEQHHAHCVVRVGCLLHGFVRCLVLGPLLEERDANVPSHLHALEVELGRRRVEKRRLEHNVLDVHATGLHQDPDLLYLLRLCKKAVVKAQLVQAHRRLGNFRYQMLRADPGLGALEVRGKLIHIADLRGCLHASQLGADALVCPPLSEHLQRLLGGWSFLGVEQPGAAKTSCAPLASLAVHRYDVLVVPRAPFARVDQELDELVHHRWRVIMDLEANHFTSNRPEGIRRIGQLRARAVDAEGVGVCQGEEAHNVTQRIAVEANPEAADRDPHRNQLRGDVREVQVDVLFRVYVPELVLRDFPLHRQLCVVEALRREDEAQDAPV
mmetsp:Transcript_73126/g.188632  ORF Transcript_73126/g.188632 Transcript_73126/m.188632 type:complete len:376 (-) Transcript_73126:89-1216(-)